MVGSKRIDAVVTLWAAGVQASPLGKLLGFETDKRGCVLVDENLNPPGHPEIFVCGDLAHVEQDGRQIPGVAQPAMQMGDVRGARMVVRRPRGTRPRTTASTTSTRATWPPSAAWPPSPRSSGRSKRTGAASWPGSHGSSSTSTSSSASATASASSRQWAWTYFTFTHGARLITGSQVLPGWNEQPGVNPAPFDPTSPGFLDHHHGAVASQSVAPAEEVRKQAVS